MLRAALQTIDSCRQRLHFLDRRLVDPKRRLQDLRLIVDDRLERLQLAFARHMERLQTHHSHLYKRLLLVRPIKIIQHYQSIVHQLHRDLTLHCRRQLENRRFQLKGFASKLESLSPLAVLGRGYSISFRLPEKAIIRKASDVQPGDEVLIRPAQGLLICTVRKSEEDGSL